jgi:hypothetical protein
LYKEQNAQIQVWSEVVFSVIDRTSKRMSMDGAEHRIAEGVLARSVGDSLVLFHPGTERLLTLNATGARVWQLLVEGMKSSQIVERLLDEYAGPESLIRQQVGEFLAHLEAEQITQRIAPESGGMPMP